MSNKVFNTRIQNKHGTEADWAQAINFTPLLGELIVYDADENYSVQRIKIGDGVSNVNALPFVNTPDWNAKEGEEGHILNRPFYTDKIEGRSFVNEQSVNIEDPDQLGYGVADIESELFPEVGDECTVIFDQKQYKCVAYGGGNNPIVLGDLEASGWELSPNGEIENKGNGEPFCFEFQPWGGYVYSTEIGNHTLSVYIEAAEIIHKLDSKYLPDELNKLLGEDGIIKQDVLPEGYPYIGSGIIVEETVAVDEESGQGFIINEFNLIKDESYTVNWNGVEYSCIAKDFMIGDVLETIALGNTAALDGNGEPTDEPFIILYLSEALQSQFSAYGLLMALDGSTEVVLSISGRIVYKMSKDLLPETGMINIKDGDNGSIRGTFTAGAMGSIATAIGYQTMALGDYSYAEGYSDYNIQDSITTETTLEEILEERKNGNYLTLAFGQASHAEGYNVLAYGNSSHAEGYGTIASGSNSHAEGTGTKAYGDYTHAEGYGTTASGDYSHAEGGSTTASGNNSHAEGMWTTASGDYSHAEGAYTTASGNNSHAEGAYTTASGDNQHVQGKYNIEDTNNQYAHIVGNGKYNTDRSNAHTVDWSGNAWYAGDVYVGSTGRKEKDEGSEKLVKTSELNKKPGLNVEGNVYTIDGTEVTAGIGAEIFNTYNGVYANIATGSYAHAEGNNNKATGNMAHAEGYFVKATGLESHAEGCDSTASGQQSHAEGNRTTASSNYSHAEGYGTTASGTASHAEGYGTTASNNYSHAEGKDTTASATASHAEGQQTSASGNYSHTEGWGTKAYGSAQHVQGRFNKTSSTYAHIIGNGSSDSARSNAHTVDWNGNAWFAGNIKIGGTYQDDGNAKSLATIDYVDTAINSISIIVQDDEPSNAPDGTLWLDTDAVAAASPDLTLQTILDYVIANLPKAEEASI